MNRMSILKGLLRFKNILYVSGHETGRVKSRLAKNAILGCSTAGLGAKDGGHATELYGTILALRQTVFISLYQFHALT